MPGLADDVLWLPGEHEVLSETRWSETRARDAIESIVTDAERSVDGCVWPPHPLDDLEDPSTTIYLGSAGVIWALHELGCSLDLPSLITDALTRYRAQPDFGDEAHAPSLWMGETGLLVAMAAVGAAPELDRLAELVHQNRSHPTWELMWGSPGTILAARACGLADAEAESARLLWERWDEQTNLWTQELYGHVRQFLGPPHGFAGNAHALRGHVPETVLRERVTAALERTAMRQDALANWPPAIAPPGRDALRVQWCHGAPGIVATLADLMPTELALAGGELTWRAGPLRKGPGLCHGTAGNGYALLRLAPLTGEERWLERARRFAMHAIEQVEHARERFGRGRYALWTGDVGVALYLRSCINADPSVPTIDVW